ncbi:MAG: glycosyltransferase family 2 protein [Actinomycetota bacterium]|nr:glycosyltransferase family 2 protein [Actinomycetota bacterium]
MPLRRWRADPDDELIGYLGWLGDRVETIVVDGSGPEVFAAHRRSFGSLVTHVPVDADLTGRYGKVNGVVTGVRAAGREGVVIADDDVRYDAAGLERMATLLDAADLVRPQNYFEPLPWHARWDTARTLVNRAFGADYPGTLGLRRSLLLDVDGYDGDCLFENLELIRTIEAAGGRVVSPLDFYVRRLPPPASHFWSQRVRQAYDDFALPPRMAVELAVVPGVAVLLARRRPRALAAPAVLAMAMAEVGRRRAGGARVFPATCSLLAPAWLGERGVCAWLAVWNRLVFGGVPYAGTVLSKAANSRRALERRLAPAGVGPVAEPELSPESRARCAGPCPDPCR